MKILLFIGCSLLALCAAGQSGAEQLATRIAKKMKDSLSLTASQQTQIYTINMQLHQQKQQVFTRYQASDSLRIHLQRIENSRDTLYSSVLSPDKYLLYRQKKRNLISNN